MTEQQSKTTHRVPAIAIVIVIQLPATMQDSN